MSTPGPATPPPQALPASWRLRQEAAVVGPLRSAPGRTLVAVIAIALGVALGFAIYLINRVAADEVQLASQRLFGVADLSVRAPGGGLDERLYPRVATLPGIAVASPVVELQARLPGRELTLRLLGIDPFRAAALHTLPAGPAAATRATGLLAEDSVWLSPSAAHGLGLAVGDPLEVQSGLDMVRLRIAGLLPSGAYRQPLGMLDIATAQWRFARLGRLDRIDLRLAPDADPRSVAAAITALLPPGVRVTTPVEAGNDAIRLSRAYRANLTALALVALFTGAFLVYSTQSLAVARRRRELALLHALGMTAREQVGAALASGAIVGAIGSALGVALGYVAARAGLAVFGADLGAGYFRGVVPEFELSAFEVPAFFLLGVAVAVAATVGPAREAASVPAAAALKAGDAPPLPAREHGRLAALMLAAAAIALTLPAVDGIPLAGYAAIALLLLGAVLVTPAVAHAAIARLPAHGPAWRQVATANLRGTARSSTVSIAAVLVSFALMVAMAIMVHSFRQSLDAWMQRILPADLYVRAGSSATTAYIDVDAQARLGAVPGVARVDFIRAREVALPDSGLPLTVIARTVTEADAAQVLPLRRQARSRAPAGTIPVWASEAARDLRGFDVGTEFDLPLGGRTVRASVRGLWRDYERPGGAVVIPRAAYRELTDDALASSAALWLAPGAGIDETETRVREALAARAGFDLARPGEIRTRALAVFDRTFAVTYILEAIAVVIGLVGIGASVSAQVLARRAEFGMLRHLGVTRREIGRMLAFEGATTSALGVLLGLVVGVIVSLVLIHVVNRQSFHWTIDLQLPWWLLAALSTLLVGAAAIVAVVSGRQALGADVVQAVKEDW